MVIHNYDSKDNANTAGGSSSDADGNAVGTVASHPESDKDWAGEAYVVKTTLQLGTDKDGNFVPYVQVDAYTSITDFNNYKETTLATWRSNNPTADISGFYSTEKDSYYLGLEIQYNGESVTTDSFYGKQALSGDNGGVVPQVSELTYKYDWADSNGDGIQNTGTSQAQDEKIRVGSGSQARMDVTSAPSEDSDYDSYTDYGYAIEKGTSAGATTTWWQAVDYATKPTAGDNDIKTGNISVKLSDGLVAVLPVSGGAI